MSTEELSGIVPEALDDQRLDRALSFLCPGLSLRQRRALFEVSEVRVNGRPARPGMRVRVGMEVRICTPVAEAEPSAGIVSCKALQVVVEHGGVAAVNKPSGMHSGRGRGDNSVEGCLPVLFAGRRVRLLNRLDALTTGLVLVGCSREGAARYLDAQEQGSVRKEYLAVVEGTLEDRVEIRNRLDSARRRKVRFLPTENPDSRRHTLVIPVGASAGKTLVRVWIVKGQRHQIRAHLAGIGYPIVGDPLYGTGPGRTMFLHHARIEFAGFSAECVPDWLGPDGSSVLLLDAEK